MSQLVHNRSKKKKKSSNSVIKNHYRISAVKKSDVNIQNECFDYKNYVLTIRWSSHVSNTAITM